ncbi:MAG: hypothetical protein FJ395_17990, partial [Verrucomicrobia bacterium]|nr:hypothetical protein [Verrucomicrobiota bacterium]
MNVIPSLRGISNFFPKRFQRFLATLGMTKLPDKPAQEMSNLRQKHFNNGISFPFQLLPHRNNSIGFIQVTGGHCRLVRGIQIREALPLRSFSNLRITRTCLDGWLASEVSICDLPVGGVLDRSLNRVGFFEVVHL